MSAALILTIDDNRLFRWATATGLGRAGYRMQEAAIELEGLALARAGRPEAPPR